MRRLVLGALLLAGCHEIVAIEAPPRGGGRTGVWIVSTTSEVIAGRLACPRAESTSPLDTCLEVQAFRLNSNDIASPPVFPRRGDLHVAFLEYACAPDVIGLPEGVVPLVEAPSDHSRLPRASAAHAYDFAKGSWIQADPTTGWIDAALRSLPVDPRLRCRLRGVDFDVRSVPLLSEARTTSLPSGDALLLSRERTIRYSGNGETDDLSLTGTVAGDMHLTGAALVDEQDRLWLVDGRGAVHRTAFADTMVAPRRQWVTPAPWSRLLPGGPNTFYMSTRVDVGDADRGPTTALARYERDADRWTTLYHVTTTTETRGASLADILPLDDDTVLMVGADVIVDIADLTQPVGSGRILEVTRTSSTWSTLVTDSGQPAIAVALARVPTLGVIASGVVCGVGMPCDQAHRIKSVLFRREDGGWREIPGMRFDFGVFAIAPLDRGLWLGGFAELRFGGFGVFARFDDGLTCQGDSNSARPSVLDILPLGERGLFVAGYAGEASRQYLLTPRNVTEPDCAASAY